MTKKNRGRRFNLMLYGVFWLLLTAMFAGLIVMQASRYNGYRRDLDQVTLELQDEEKIYEELQDQMAYYDSDAYIEQLARDQLGYVRPDEIVFINLAD